LYGKRWSLSAFRVFLTLPMFMALGTLPACPRSLFPRPRTIMVTARPPIMRSRWPGLARLPGFRLASFAIIFAESLLFTAIVGPILVAFKMCVLIEARWFVDPRRQKLEVE
jgi:hypothetical protein